MRWHTTIFIRWHGMPSLQFNVFLDMGRYKRKSNRESWDENNMQETISAVKAERMGGWLLASKTFNVPFRTLRRRATKEEGWKKVT